MLQYNYVHSHAGLLGGVANVVRPSNYWGCQRTQDSLEIVPYAEDELVLVLPVFHPFAKRDTIQRRLYKLEFIALDSQSTIRRVTLC